MLIYLQVAWQSPSTTQLRTRATIQSVYFKVKCISCPHQISSDAVLPTRTPQPPTISPSFMSDLISRSCEMATTFSIFLISQMPLSRFASLRRRFGVLFESLVELGVTFKDTRDLQDVYSALWLVKPGQVWGAIMANLLSKRPSVFHGNIVTVWCWCFYPKMLWWKNGINGFFSPLQFMIINKLFLIILRLRLEWTLSIWFAVTEEGVMLTSSYLNHVWSPAT